jgi:phosphoglycolate phosphatase
VASLRPPIRAILFDKDGTLIDYRASWLGANRAAARDLAVAAGRAPAFADELLRGLGYEPAEDRFVEDSPLLWASNAQIVALWSGQPELVGLPDVLERVERQFSDLEAHPPVAVTDLAVLFGRLCGCHLTLGVATMDSTAAAEAMLARFGIRHQVRFVAGWDAGHGIKPDPGMVLAFCRAVKVEPCATAVVGDNLADLAMARAAGAGLAIAVLTGGCPAEVLAREADLVLASVADLDLALGTYLATDLESPA